MSTLNSIIENLALSVDPMMKMISGFCYVIGVNLLWVALKKVNKIGDFRARCGVGSPLFVPVTYMMGGLVFIYLPSFLEVARNTFFGVSSPMAYADGSAISIWLSDLKDKYGNIVYGIMRLVNLAGLVWFVRGVALLVQASEPGIQHGPKGLAFMLAGIFALNVEYSEKLVASLMDFITKASL